MPTASVMHSKGHYINGQWTKGSGPVLDSLNPTNNTLLWQGTHASEQEIMQAAASAQHALNAWAMTSFEQRAAYVQQFAQQIEQHKEVLARIISKETGKPLWESTTEVAAV
ncbi:MAG: aldehyde dehydrogenase family protein, partial [Legionella sp.]